MTFLVNLDDILSPRKKPSHLLVLPVVYVIQCLYFCGMPRFIGGRGCSSGLTFSYFLFCISICFTEQVSVFRGLD